VRRSAPRPLAHALTSLADELAPPSQLAEVQRAWPAAVGEAIAGEAQPVAARGGVVTVACSSSLWAHELDLLSGALVERLNDSLDGRPVRRLRCVTTPVRSGP
jgi:predicted nucleic acid-binding Zn ribbon protein